MRTTSSNVLDPGFRVDCSEVMWISCTGMDPTRTMFAEACRRQRSYHVLLRVRSLWRQPSLSFRWMDDLAATPCENQSNSTSKKRTNKGRYTSITKL